MIAIKGTKMPRCCVECDFRTDDYCYARTNPPYSHLTNNIFCERANDCPLVEIVLCRDCKHNTNMICDIYGIELCCDDNYYCALGGRRESNATERK